MTLNRSQLGTRKNKKGGNKYKQGFYTPQHQIGRASCRVRV